MGFNFATAAGKTQPKKGSANKFDNGLAGLPDNFPDGQPYHFVIDGVGEKRDFTDRKGKEHTVITIPIMVVGGPHDGLKGKWETFTDDQEQFDRFAGNVLGMLGFDATEWVKAGVDPQSEAGGKFFNDCMMRSLACMKGLKFEGKKKANPGTNKNPDGTTQYFQNIYVDKRLDDGKPLKITPAEMESMLALDF